MACLYNGAEETLNYVLLPSTPNLHFPLSPTQPSLKQCSSSPDFNGLGLQVNCLITRPKHLFK